MRPFVCNDPVWMTRNGKRFRAVTVEAPGDESVFTFMLQLTRELIGELTDAEFELFETLGEDAWPKSLVWFPETSRIGYMILGTSGFSEFERGDDGEYADDVSEFNMLWDGFAVSPREVLVTPGDFPNRSNYTETDNGTTWEITAHPVVFKVDYRCPPGHIGYADIGYRRVGFRFKSETAGDENVDEYVINSNNSGDYEVLAVTLRGFGVTHVLDTELFGKPIEINRWAKYLNRPASHREVAYLDDDGELEIVNLMLKALKADADETGDDDDDDPCYDRVYVSRKSDTEVSIGDNWEHVSFYIIHKNGEWFTRRRRDGLDGPITFDEAKKLAGNYWNN